MCVYLKEQQQHEKARFDEIKTSSRPEHDYSHENTPKGVCERLKEMRIQNVPMVYSKDKPLH